MEVISLNFYGVGVEISCSEELAKLMGKDFEFFVSEGLDEKHFQLLVANARPPYEKIHGLRPCRQSDKCTTYKSHGLLFNDYHGQALSIYDKVQGQVEIYSENFDLLHELTYLVTLSLSGKKLDLMGLHKVHAFALAFKKTALIGMMPSHGGKSTLLLDLLAQNSHYQILSDDTPMVDRKGKIHPFPSRVGVNDINEYQEVFDPSKIYSLKRRFYGLKTLIPITAFQNHVVRQSPERIILFEGLRIHSEECYIKKASIFKSLRGLFHHMVIGIGLPIIIEYFLDPSLEDIPKRGKIFFSRLFSAIRLSLKAKKYVIYLGIDRQKNAQRIGQLLEQD